MSVVGQSTVAEPAWVDLSSLRAARVPADVALWLKDRGSLTKALVRACNGQFRVDVQHQGWGMASSSERRLLGMPSGLTSMLREVDLLCDEQPWVFARTVIPATSLRGRARRLAHLQNKPLGAVLFSDPQTRRRSIEIARITPRHALYLAACSHLAEKPAEVWGRRTLFEYAGKLILVNEIFLPR